MKRIITAATAMVAALLLFGSARAQGREAGRLSKEEREVLAANREWADAMVRGDAAALERLFHDELVVTSGNGTVRDKAGELKDAGPSDIKTYFFNTEDVRVRVYDDAAVVTGHARWRINYKGRDVDNERRYTSLYVKEKGRWRMVALQITRLPERQAQ